MSVTSLFTNGLFQIEKKTPILWYFNDQRECYLTYMINNQLCVIVTFSYLMIGI